MATRINKRDALDKLTADYLQAVSDLIPTDAELEKMLETIELSSHDKKVVKSLELDSLSTLVLASILGY